MTFNLSKPSVKWSLVGAGALLAVLAFYWLEVRPILVKKDCSWLTYTEPAKEAFAGISQEEADRTNAENRRENPAACSTATGLDTLFLECKSTNVRAQPPRPAEPAREVKRSATKIEYEQCLRHNGLL